MASILDGVRSTRHGLENMALLVAYVLEHQHITLCLLRQDDDDKRGIALMGQRIGEGARLGPRQPGGAAPAQSRKYNLNNMSH